MKELLRGKIRMEIADSLFRLSTDSMVLADFARIRNGCRVLDLGCGCGTLGLLLLADDPSLHVTGIELQACAAETALRNVRHNALDDSFRVIHADLREYSALNLANGFDAVISNPPYYPVESGKQADEQPLSIARSEVCCTLADLCRSAAGCLRFGGSFTLVHKPERLADLICTLRSCRLEPKRIQFVRHSALQEVSLVLMEARLGGKPGLKFEPDLILFSPDGAPTDQYRRIYAI
ncbi:MAG: methyltransferase [Clostridia bacterium]|nr:methyltransferase [Clostridia bacterium]